ncbi:MAG: pyruvate:ferredoxin (flavodoxin) oxidoreductase, partial [Negativicoccus succinicivorans]|nr:pyruvate:ferredoxin (flavodoxin) oxidoreductase [Negativicoccus succinicivorans]
MLIANATGCSSIYGGNLPSTPYTTDANGRGPAWANSLFEDNAEFGLGFRLTVDQHRARVMRLLAQFADKIPAELNDALHAEATPDVRRAQVAELRNALKGVEGAEQLLTDADALVEKSVWLI